MHLQNQLFFLADDIATSKKDKELGISLIKQLAGREYTTIKPKTIFAGRAKIQSILTEKAETGKNYAEQEIESIFNKALQATSDNREQQL